MKDYVRRIIQKFTSSFQNKEDVYKIHQWLVEPEHADEKEWALYEVWTETEGCVETDMQKSLDAIYRKAGVVEPRKKYISLWRVTRYAAAIALLLVSVSSTFYLTKDYYAESDMVEYYTRAGEVQYIDLPDGTRVQTNSGTLLLFPKKFTGKTRTVFLQGEANFKVKPNPEQPFIVRSNTLAVTALGTEFNVSAYADKEEIVATLLEGKVKVACGTNGESYILAPGQQLAFKKDMGESRLSDAVVEDVTAWQKGILVFRSVTVKEILATLQRKYNVAIRYDKYRFNDDKYNFRFLEKSDLQGVLNVMKVVVGDFDYVMEDGACVIK